MPGQMRRVFWLLLFLANSREMLAQARKKKPGRTNLDVMRALERGYRMPRPQGCPQELYEIMMRCWKQKPEDRPTFEYIQSILEDFFTGTEKQYQ